MTDVNDTLTRAGLLIGAELTGGTDLGGSPRSLTLRAHRPDGSGVIVKAYRTAEYLAESCYVNEAAGLSFGVGGGPELIASDAETRMTVMTDLGKWPSLADRLLGDDPDLATQALLAWAETYGAMGRASLDREEEFDALRERFGIGEEPVEPLWDAPKIAKLRDMLSGVGVTTTAAFARELDDLSALRDIGPRVFSPGDICPDNNLLTDAGFRAIDFEGASYRSAYLDAAYVTMPFATCWCVAALPPGLADRVSDAYWTALLGRPARRGETEGVKLATVHWTFDLMLWLLDRAFETEAPMHAGREGVSTRRQVLRHRFQTAAPLLDGMPAISAVIARLLELTADWPEIQRYPAFKSETFKAGG